jgi:hypothetical protein
MEPWWAADSSGPTTEPGTHALVIGVSRYENLPPGASPSEPWVVGMQQLESAAITAAEFARWMRKTHYLPDAPLRSIWLLLSPSAAELPSLTSEEQDAPAARLENVEKAVDAWVATCRCHRDNVAVFYAAGHGIGQNRAEPGVLLLEDFAAKGMEAVLQHTLSVTTVHAALAGSPRGAPRRQFGFFDACRTRHPASLTHELSGAWPPWSPATTPTAETSPLYLSTADGAPSYGRPGRATLFWEVLRSCLTEHAVTTLDGRDNVWGVSDDRLLSPVKTRLRSLAEDEGVHQDPTVVHAPAGVPFHVCRVPPSLERTFAVAPASAGVWARGTLRHDDRAPPVFADVRLEAPHTETVPAGNYEVSVTIDPDHPQFVDRRLWRMIRPGGEPRIDVPVVQTQAEQG